MYLLITNNEELYKVVKTGKYVEDSALGVLIEVRDRVHVGSTLLTNPLCGNLRPMQQPYRSVLIEEKVGGGGVDLESLTLIEESIRIYRTGKLMRPEELDENTRKDYAYIDCELMRESLEQYGMINTGNQFRAAELRTKIF